MTEEDLVKAAYEAGLKDGAKEEREECAKLCEKSDRYRYRGEYFAAKIRERGNP
jgi:hypothetical protein